MSNNRYTCIIIMFSGLLMPLVGGCSANRARVTLGIISDVEYTSGGNSKGQMEKLLHGVDYFNRERLLDKESVYSGTRKVKFVIQLGNIIDGATATAVDLETAVEEYDRIKKRTYSVIGDSDIARLDKKTVLKKLGIKSSYYDFTYSKWRFIVLDTTILESISQKNWLKDVLASTRKKRQNVIVFGHHPLASDGEDIKKIFASSGNVVAYINGNDRKRDYVYSDGIYYITIAAMADSSAEDSRSVLWVYKDRLELQGSTNQPWIAMPF